MIEPDVPVDGQRQQTNGEDHHRYPSNEVEVTPEMIEVGNCLATRMEERVDMRNLSWNCAASARAGEGPCYAGFCAFFAVFSYSPSWLLALRAPTPGYSDMTMK
jgi:hypothetical protein